MGPGDKGFCFFLPEDFREFVLCRLEFRFRRLRSGRLVLVFDFYIEPDACFFERETIEVDQELDVVAGLPAGSAPVGSLAVVIFRPDVKAIVPATRRTRTNPFSAVRRGDFFQVHFLLRQVKDVHNEHTLKTSTAQFKA